MRTQAILHLSLVYLALLAPAAEAGRPLVVDDAGTVAPYHLEMTLAFSQAMSPRNQREQIGPIITVTYGLAQAVELGMSIQRISQEIKGATRREGFEDLHLSAKYRFPEQNDAFPALALSFDLRLPTASREKDLSPSKTDESFLLIATKKWTTTALHLNLGYSVVGSSEDLRRKNRLGGGGAVDMVP
jgi:Putative MetA-pathway of phenol degradation